MSMFLSCYWLLLWLCLYVWSSACLYWCWHPNTWQNHSVLDDVHGAGMDICLVVSFWWWIISRTCQGEIPSSTCFPKHITDPDLSAGTSHPGHSWLPYRSSYHPQTAALLMSSSVLCHNTGRGRDQVPTLVALLIWRPTPLIMLPQQPPSACDQTGNSVSIY